MNFNGTILSTFGSRDGAVFALDSSGNLKWKLKKIINLFIRFTYVEPIFDQIFESRSFEELYSSSTFDENDDYGDLEDIMDFNHQVRDGLAKNAEILISKAEHFPGVYSDTSDDDWDDDWDE